MQVLYLWIKNHRDFICEQSVNFGGKFTFSYNMELKQLNVEDNPSYTHRGDGSIDAPLHIDRTVRNH